jgi:hypothetical protein
MVSTWAWPDESAIPGQDDARQLVLETLEALISRLQEAVVGERMTVTYWRLCCANGSPTAGPGRWPTIGSAGCGRKPGGHGLQQQTALAIRSVIAASEKRLLKRKQ